MAYPDLCQMLDKVIVENPGYSMDWFPGNVTEQQQLTKIVLKYTQENILKLKLYIKDPFAVKYRILQNASM